MSDEDKAPGETSLWLVMRLVIYWREIIYSFFYTSLVIKESFLIFLSLYFFCLCWNTWCFFILRLRLERTGFFFLAKCKLDNGRISVIFFQWIFRFFKLVYMQGRQCHDSFFSDILNIIPGAISKVFTKLSFSRFLNAWVKPNSPISGESHKLR